ncbi:MAG: DUF1573 domain-containing protein [Tannerellaceae bacterium]|jgi:archaellum component FlaG (FlaF/FlaG flagellin family)|nr:DUF1573 domain-containing protein [Tannerellaceae bacterium]
MRRTTHIIQLIAVLIILLPACIANAQKGAVIGSDMQTHDFGRIAEADGLATHSFTIKNTGVSALVINRITASCGCTRPEWSKEPIAPGGVAEVKVSYNPKGRPGPFYKSITIHSNAGGEKLTLYIKGTVKNRTTEQPAITYPYSIGDLKMQTKAIQYSRIHPGETQEETVRIKNEGKASLTVHHKAPDYITLEVNPPSLGPGETGEVSIQFNTDRVKKMGRVSAYLPLWVESGDIGGEKTEDVIHVAANIIDNFSRLPSYEKAKAPSAQFSLTLLDFGALPSKSGGIISFIGIGGKESESLTVTNTGQSPLLIYSVSCDNVLLDISGGKKELKPGGSSTYKVSIRPRDIKTSLETFIHILTNDPDGPVRLIKVTAHK